MVRYKEGRCGLRMRSSQHRPSVCVCCVCVNHGSLAGDGHGSLRQADGEADRGGGAPAEQPATLRPSGRQARCNFLFVSLLAYCGYHKLCTSAPVHTVCTHSNLCVFNSLTHIDKRLTKITSLQVC